MFCGRLQLSTVLSFKIKDEGEWASTIEGRASLLQKIRTLLKRLLWAWKEISEYTKEQIPRSLPLLPGKMAWLWLHAGRLPRPSSGQYTGREEQHVDNYRWISVTIRVTSCMALNGIIHLSLTLTFKFFRIQESFFHMTILYTQHPSQNI